MVSANDYYPFGMTMPGRKFNSGAYRYGFNGKENDKETETQDYGFRIYNPALGKFLSVDPLTKDYPMLTPYQFASNRPIDGLDMDGLEYITFFVKVIKDGQSKTHYNVSIAEDYRGMTGEQMAAIHGRRKRYARPSSPKDIQNLLEKRDEGLSFTTLTRMGTNWENLCGR